MFIDRPGDVVQHCVDEVPVAATRRDRDDAVFGDALEARVVSSSIPIVISDGSCSPRRSRRKFSTSVSCVLAPATFSGEWGCWGLAVCGIAPMFAVVAPLQATKIDWVAWSSRDLHRVGQIVAVAGVFVERRRA